MNSLYGSSPIFGEREKKNTKTDDASSFNCVFHLYPREFFTFGCGVCFSFSNIFMHLIFCFSTYVFLIYKLMTLVHVFFRDIKKMLILKAKYKKTQEILLWEKIILRMYFFIIFFKNIFINKDNIIYIHTFHKKYLIQTNIIYIIVLYKNNKTDVIKKNSYAMIMQ